MITLNVLSQASGVPGQAPEKPLARLRGVVLALLALTGAEAYASPADEAAIVPPLTVVFVGNDPRDAGRFEEWLGRDLDGVQIHGGSAGWDDWINSIAWLAGLWRDQGRRIFWSVPLIPKGADLASAAAGLKDDAYGKAALIIAAASPEGEIYIRTGWEFNGDWMPWAARGREAEFVRAFRNFVAAFRSASDRFRFEWTPNIGDHGMNPEAAWPGDDVVDVVGLDFYYFPQWDGADPQPAWRSMVERRFGLAWHQAFAASHGKPTAYAEWGVSIDAADGYIAEAADWFRTHPVVYQSYWNSDADYPGRLDAGRMPAVGAAYRAAFGPNAPSIGASGQGGEKP